MADRPVFSIVVPAYNEELVVGEAYGRLKGTMDAMGEPYEIVFVNDGSRDLTCPIIESICAGDPNVRLIDLSRNFGHQIAITAGMDKARGDAVVVIDCDLQDPPGVIPLMAGKWREGYDVVYGKRIKRKGEGFLKRLTSKAFYRLMRRMTEVDIPVDVGDFRLIDRKVCEAMGTVRERSRYIRGLISWVGFRQTFVEFERDARFAGETKYPFRKMVKLALNGITSFSYKPLKIATYFGTLLSFAGFAYLLVVLYQRLFTDSVIQGWASILIVNLLFNGITLILLGIIGEYIGRIHDEVKGRPLYVIMKETNMGDG
ncbi:MAG: glycosyltransferase family 2 protein [Oscillospiraceae bacterium]|nr:glycosyltransferase family 2 protein [Oscillospiraceae bacterium]